MSIKRKLTLMTMGISLTATALTAMAITSYLIYDMRRSNIQALGVTSAMAGDRNSAALLFLDKERARSNLEIFRLSPSILAACIYNGQGALFAGYEAEGSAPQKCPATFRETSHPLEGLLTATREIHNNKEIAGYVFMASDTREIDIYVQKIIQISATVTLFVLGITLLLTFYFRRTISGPILRLAADVQSITGRRDYIMESPANYPDETGILAHAFNEMLAEVRKRDRELQKNNETLEEKVSARTHELTEAMRKAESANEAKNEFLRNMSHEFRTPLHAIVSFSSYGEDEHEKANRQDLRKYFEMIQKGAQSLSHLVNEVLDLAKLEQGGGAFSMEPVDICELVAQTADMMRPLLEKKSIALSVVHAHGAADALCDSNKISQVLINLLSNAIKFTPPGKRITLRTFTEGAQVVVSLIDRGIGIPEEERETIFESFRQSSRTNTGAGGTGLGLAICRNIIKAHNGRIWAENNPDGKGARLTFTLPAAREILSLPEVRYESAHAV